MLGGCRSLYPGRMNSTHVYTLRGNNFEQVHQKKDHGMIIDNQLKFHTHTSNTVNKSNKIPAVTEKPFMHLDMVTVSLLYKSMIRPHLDYGNFIWGPHYKVGPASSRESSEVSNQPSPRSIGTIYKEHLRWLHIPSLCAYHRRGDMIEINKIMTGVA